MLEILQSHQLARYQKSHCAFTNRQGAFPGSTSHCLGTLPDLTYTLLHITWTNRQSGAGAEGRHTDLLLETDLRATAHKTGELIVNPAAIAITRHFVTDLGPLRISDLAHEAVCLPTHPRLSSMASTVAFTSHLTLDTILMHGLRRQGRSNLLHITIMVLRKACIPMIRLPSPAGTNTGRINSSRLNFP